MQQIYRAVIVDDERLARLELKRLLAAHPDVEVVDEASGVSDAIPSIEMHRPDLLFLDIQLRNETGFELLNRVTFEGQVIFVTAWDQYAIRAFEVNALDYLLKPVSPGRLAESLARLDSKVDGPHQHIPKKLTPEDIIFIHFGTRLKFQRVDDILLLRASGAYSELTTIKGENGLVPKALKEWEERLPETLFLRVHRNTMINLAQVGEVEPWSNHAYRITLKGFPEAVIVSRRYAKRLREWRG